MARADFMIYGAYGHTGLLIARRAIARGHRPLLAGRDPEQLRRVAGELSLPSIVVGIDEPGALASAVERVRIVCHAAGPFVHTAAPMIAACLAARTSYVDITGEIPVFEHVFSRHADAENANICLIPGLGFDVVPSDCLARFVAERVAKPVELEIAVSVRGRPSAGTVAASVEGLLRGNFVRRKGVLERIAFGQGARDVRFLDGPARVLPIPWGDLVTAFHTTGIADITTFMALPETLVLAARALGPVGSNLGRLLGGFDTRRISRWLSRALVRNPTPREQDEGSAQLWARASDAKGRYQEAWMETRDGYAFTAESVVLGIERLLERPLSGASTPALAFGVDYALAVAGTQLYEHL